MRSLDQWNFWQAIKAGSRIMFVISCFGLADNSPGSHSPTATFGNFMFFLAMVSLFVSIGWWELPSEEWMDDAKKDGKQDGGGV